jgi:hypothetical protein
MMPSDIEVKRLIFEFNDEINIQVKINEKRWTIMNTGLSVCGCSCGECEHYKRSECSGCNKIKGKVWWTKYISATVCPVYQCVVHEMKFEHCGLCPEIPCRIWRELKDPSYTDQEHEDSINERVEILKNLNTLNR